MSLLIPVEAFGCKFFEITEACIHFCKKRFSRVFRKNVSVLP